MTLDDSSLWHALDRDPPAPSGVDITRAIAEGRRRRVRRASAVAGIALLATVAMVAVPIALWRHPAENPAVAAATTETPSAAPTSSAPVVLPAGPTGGGQAQAPTACTVHRLPTPKGVTMGLVAHGDPTGRYLVGRVYPRSNDLNGVTPVIWADGKVISVPMPGEDADLWGINASGHAVGSSFMPNGDQGSIETAWLYRDGQLIQLHGSYADARAINAAGVIVGQDRRTPVVWRSPDADPTPLTTESGEAYGIDHDGTIVGSLWVNGSDRPVVWYPDGSQHDLLMPDGFTQGRAFSVQSGWATGWGQGSGGTVGMRWNVRTGEVTAFPGLDIAEYASAEGWVVGSAPDGHAAYGSEAGTFKLPPVAEPVEIDIAMTVSADGKTVGGQSTLTDKDRTIVAVVWRCS
jgi:hypothetical protein